MRKKEKRDLLGEIIGPMDKITPKCAMAGTCGGCFMQEIDYPLQVRAKHALLVKLFERGNIPLDLPDVVPSPDVFYYRNRMDYPVGYKGEIGLKPVGKWREILNVADCFLLSPETPAILQEVRNWMTFYKLTGWDAVTHKGYIRYVVIREGKHTSERMITIVCAAHPETVDVEMVWNDLVHRLKPFATTIYRGMQLRVTDISEADELELLYGAPELREIINGLEFRIAPFSFFQTNSNACALLQNYVVDEVMDSLKQKDQQRVLDLYCGAGFLTLPLAARDVHVRGVELVEAAIEKAKENALLNNLQAEFFALKAEEHIKSLDKGMYETIIVDPPRAGLHPKVITKLCAVAPETLIYVSCNPSRLVDELPELLETFSLEHVKAFDMFPHTPHVELVVTLRRK